MCDFDPDSDFDPDPDFGRRNTTVNVARRASVRYNRFSELSAVFETGGVAAACFRVPRLGMACAPRKD